MRVVAYYKATQKTILHRSVTTCAVSSFVFIILRRRFFHPTTGSIGPPKRNIFDYQ